MKDSANWIELLANMTDVGLCESVADVLGETGVRTEDDKLFTRMWNVDSATLGCSSIAWSAGGRTPHSYEEDFEPNSSTEELEKAWTEEFEIMLQVDQSAFKESGWDPAFDLLDFEDFWDVAKKKKWKDCESEFHRCAYIQQLFIRAALEAIAESVRRPGGESRYSFSSDQLYVAANRLGNVNVSQDVGIKETAPRIAPVWAREWIDEHLYFRQPLIYLNGKILLLSDDANEKPHQFGGVLPPCETDGKHKTLRSLLTLDRNQLPFDFPNLPNLIQLVLNFDAEELAANYQLSDRGIEWTREWVSARTPAYPKLPKVFKTIALGVAGTLEVSDSEFIEFMDLHNVKETDLIAVVPSVVGGVHLWGEDDQTTVFEIDTLSGHVSGIARS